MNRDATPIQLPNNVRLTRATLLKELRGGSRDVVNVLADDESGVSVFDVLCTIPRVGPTRAIELFKKLGISELVTLGGRFTSAARPATERERRVLVETVEHLSGAELRKEAA